MKKLITFIVAIFVLQIFLFAEDHFLTLPISGNYVISAGWIYPASYGGGLHRGIDYVAISGTEILAAYGGEVITVVRSVADNTGTGYGNYVMIDHGNGYKTRYAHMLYNSPTVNVGDIVYQGQFIGRIGNTGTSTNTHLHFDCSYNNNPIDVYGWYSQDTNLYSSCNPNEYYFISNPPQAPISGESSRILPDDLLVHVVGTPNYYVIKDGLMRAFPSETPFYTWGFAWDDAVDISESEFNQFSAGATMPPKVGTCVYDQNYQRWVFDYASNNSTTIVKRMVNNWQQLGYAQDVWIPSTNSYLVQFAAGTPLVSNTDYPYGTVLRSSSSPSVRYVIKRGAEVSSAYAGQKVLVRLASESVYDINYYHPNFNVMVTQSVLNCYQIASVVVYEKIMDGKLISGSGPHFYYIENGLKRLIVDQLTFNAYGFNFANLIEVTDADINSFASGQNIQFFVGGGEVNYQGGELEDGGFDSGLTSYWIFNDSYNIANFSVTQGETVSGSFKSDIQVNSPVNYYEVELKQLVSVVSGGLYHISFYVRADTQTPFKLEMIKDTSPWNNYGLWKELVARTSWQKYQYVFSPNSSDGFARLTFMLGSHIGHIYFDEVVFERVDNTQTSNGNLVSNGDFESGNFSPWFMEDNNSVANYYTDNSNYHGGNISMYIDPNQSESHWMVQLRQNISVVAEETYELSFWAKSQSNRNIKVELYRDGAPWNNYGLWSEFNISNFWQRYVVQFTSNTTGSPRFAIYFGHQDIPVWIDDVIVSSQRVLNQSSDDLETDLCVYQNIPNPFNGETSIPYNTKSQNSKLCIYNVKGEIVKEYKLDSKNNYIYWNGLDKNNVQVASGVYFYKISNDFEKTPFKKMIYMK